MTALPLYGLDKELAEKAAAKFNPQRQDEAREWIEHVTGESFSSADFHEALKDGVLLCKLAQITLSDNSSYKFKSSKMPFIQMENINVFLKAMDKVGVPKNDQFMTIDLFEAKNVPQVIDSIFAFSRHVVKHGFNGPQLGPKLADKHVVSFSDEQLNAGKNIPSQQMGFTGGANASGISYGGRRNVTNPNVGTGSNEGMSTLTSGYNGGANQSGMSYGGRRNIVDPKVGTGSNEGISQLTSGYNGGANQSGMSYGGRREIGGRDSGKN